jgi:hypothetical protein
LLYGGVGVMVLAGLSFVIFNKKNRIVDVQVCDAREV